MSSQGHFNIPRSITRSTQYYSMPSKYKVIFQTILDHVSYKSEKFNDHGILIDLEPGQLCISIRELAKISGPDISRDDVVGFLRPTNICQTLRHEVRHRKSIITVIHPELCALYKRIDPTTSPTTSPTTLPLKVIKKKDIYMNDSTTLIAQTDQLVASRPASRPRKKPSLYFCFDQNKFVGIPPEEMADWREHYCAADFDFEFREMRRWCLNNPQKAKSKVRWPQFITNWLKGAHNKNLQKQFYTQSKVIPMSNTRSSKDQNGNRTPHPLDNVL